MADLQKMAEEANSVFTNVKAQIAEKKAELDQLEKAEQQLMGRLMTYNDLAKLDEDPPTSDAPTEPQA